MNKFTSFIFASLVLALFQCNAIAWNGSGHMLIAAEAFRNLSPELKAQVIEILKSHPEYKTWTNAYHPNANMDLATYVFMRCSTWPDDIRRTGNQFDHPNWHFIDYPLRPPKFTVEPDPRPTDNILFGISECEKTLGDTNASPELRAAYLSWLVHLVGDIHQPLHCESFFDDTYPKGDRGGNDFYVKLARAGVRLHAAWDDLLGSAPNPQTQWQYAIKLDSQFPENSLSELKTHTTPKDWSLESREQAIKYGYLNGHLKGGTKSESAQSVPDGYTKDAKTVAERQAGLAGYRLADEIKKYLKSGKTVPLLPQNTFKAKAVVPSKIGTAEANQFYDEELTVTGKVVQVSERSNIKILDFDKPYPETPFTAVVFEENFGAFTNLAALKNQDVEVKGTVTEYRGKPEIILETPNQIKAVSKN